MTRNQALKLALKAMRAEVKRLAVDANMFDRFKADYPLARKASLERAEYLAAVSALEALLKNGVKNVEN